MRWKIALVLAVSWIPLVAAAAPVVRPVSFTLSVNIQGIAPITISSIGSVTVDSTAGLGGQGKVSVAAGQVILATTVVVPVTSSSAVASLTAKSISNLSGAFSIGGAGSGVPATETPCPATPGIFGGAACVNQTGLGGPMGLTGTINVHVVPNIVVIPFDLANLVVGQGGAPAASFTVDAAPWTRKTGQVVFAGTTPTLTTTGTTSGSQFTLVSPTFVVCCGNILPVVGRLTVSFLDAGGLPSFVNAMLPEPGMPLLLGSALAMWGLRRARRP